MRFFYRTTLLALVLTSFGVRFASASSDQVSIGKDIVVSAPQTVGDIVCVACNVIIRGNVGGDVVAVLGSVKVEDSQWISGDLVTVGGDVFLDGKTEVQGDLVVVGGDLDTSSDATVHGDREVLPGRAWLLLPLAPFLILIGIVWLAVWLIRRSRYRFPMYPYGRGL
jgi:hypothetical protein